jgi:hypothetical protein
MMVGDRTALRLGSLLAAAAGLAVVFRILGGAHWFSCYGLATITMILAIPLLVVLRQGLEQRGYSLWLALVVVVPLVVAAAIQAGYWLAYFSSPETGISLGVGRMMFQMHVAPYMPPLYAILGIASLFVVWRATGSPATPDARTA